MRQRSARAKFVHILVRFNRDEMDVFFDPTFLFATGVMLVPLSKCDTVNESIDYVTQPSFIAPFILFFLVRLIVKATAPKASLTSTENMIANWFLCNAVFFNLFLGISSASLRFCSILDVVAGQFQSMGEMSVQYLKVEPRYQHGLHHDSGSVVFITSMMELFIQVVRIRLMLLSLLLIYS